MLNARNTVMFNAATYAGDQARWRHADSTAAPLLMNQYIKEDWLTELSETQWQLKTQGSAEATQYHECEHACIQANALLWLLQVPYIEYEGADCVTAASLTSDKLQIDNTCVAQLDSTPLIASNAKWYTNNQTIFISFFLYFTFLVWKTAQLWGCCMAQGTSLLRHRE